LNDYYWMLVDCKNVLRKLGKNPDERIGPFDQDWEYTSCRVEELADYLALYLQSTTTEGEKRILGCFMIDCLDVQLGVGKEHPLQNIILEQLFKDREVHRKELDYRMDTSDPDPAHWWCITTTLLQYAAKSNPECP
jgi:hypothetical protein